MIPAEAVEAAAEAFLRESVRRKGELGASSLALLAALEAAAPHMLAGAKAEALEEAADEISAGQRPGFVSAWLRGRAAALRNP